jgi:uroporphyrinogen III methyltransferase/synthase
MAEKNKTGKCYLVGAGPGDLGLVTLRAKECIERAEVIVYDYLCNPEMLKWAPKECELIFAGKKAGAHTLSQEEINALLVEKTAERKQVVRLKGGDPFSSGEAVRRRSRSARRSSRLRLCRVSLRRLPDRPMQAFR